MTAMPINANKTGQWKADVERSIDFYNDWFLRFAPETFRAQRRVMSELVHATLAASDDLRQLTPAFLRANPGSLPILRMACAPPIARDRLIGLAHLNRNLVQSMEGRTDSPPRLPLRMADGELDEQLQRICDTLHELIDRDLLPWLDAGTTPDAEQQLRAAMVIADRLCGAAADPIIRNAQEQRQLAALANWLDHHGYRQITPAEVAELPAMQPGTYTFRLNVAVGTGQRAVNIPIDCAVQPLDARPGNLPVLIEAKSAGDATNTNKRRKEEAQKFRQLQAQFQQQLNYLLLLCGYFEAGYLGYEAAEGLDWVWEHRLADLAVALARPTASAQQVAEPTAVYAVMTERKEERRLAAQLAVDAARTQIDRNRMGQFSTPFALAGEIVQAALAIRHSTSPIRFLEPAVGSGVFFSALENNLPVQHIARATGVELDPLYAGVAARLWDKPPFETLAGQDFLAFAAQFAAHGEQPYDLLCTNPPYVRHHHMPAAHKTQLQQRVESLLGIRPSGLSGLYIYFMLLAHPLLADGAVASWLVPSEFLVVNYGGALRDYLLRHVTLRRIHQFDPAEVQFDDALVSSCIVTYTRDAPPANHQFIYTYGGTLAAPREQRTVPTADLSARGRWALRAAQVATPVQPNAVRVADLFEIRRGIATGANKFFVVDKATIDAYELPARFLKPILPTPRILQTDTIHSNGDGFPLVEGARYLIDCDLEPHDVAAAYPGLWRYLQHGVAQGIPQGYLCANRKVWYWQEQRAPALFMATYMTRSRATSGNPFRFFLNRSAAIGTNVFLLLYPRPPLTAAIDGQAARMRELLAMLNGLTADYVVSQARTYGGGLHKLEPKELAALSLDALPGWLHPARQLALPFD